MLKVLSVIIATTAALNVEKIGRRPLWLGSTIGMMFSFCVVMGLSAGYASSKESAMGIAVIPFLFLFYGAYDIAWSALAYS
jgi:hypothetical protein